MCGMDCHTIVVVGQWYWLQYDCTVEPSFEYKIPLLPQNRTLSKTGVPRQATVIPLF